MDGGWLTALAFLVVGIWVAVLQVRPPRAPEQSEREQALPPRKSFSWWLLVLVGVVGGGVYLVGALRNDHAWWWVVVLGVVAWVAAGLVKKAVDDERPWVTRFGPRGP